MRKALVGLLLAVTVGTAAGRPAGAADQAPPQPSPEAMKTEFDALDVELHTGLAELAKEVGAFSAEPEKWRSLDRSMEVARKVNLALLARNKSVVDLYERKLSSPFARYERLLKEAPSVYRKMAEERRRLLAASTLEIERRNYLAMAETCEAAAVLCERRHEELFGTGSPMDGSESRPKRPNAVALHQTIQNMKRLQPMHEKWDETFRAYPTVLENSQLGNWFGVLSLYGEDLEAFTRNVEGLRSAMKKAVGGRPAPTVREERERPLNNPPASPPARVARSYSLPPALPQYPTVVVYDRP